MATTAKTKQDVDNMSARDRLWDSLSNSYGTKTQKSNEAYEKAYSQADRQLIGRGMQRSSYGAQTLANINKQKIDAANDIQSELIADYENRLGQLEQQELENDWREREFAANREDAAWNKEMQNKQYEANRADTSWSQNFQTEQAKQQQANTDRAYEYQLGRDAVSDEQWQKAFDQEASLATRQLAASYAQALLSAGQTVPDSLLRQAGLSIVGGQVVPATTASSGGGYSGSYSSGNNKKKTSSESDARAATDAAIVAMQDSVSKFFEDLNGEALSKNYFKNQPGRWM